MIHLIKKLTSYYECCVWLLSVRKSAVLLRFIILCAFVVGGRYLDRIHLNEYVRNLSRTHFADPKTSIQSILLDLSYRCGQGCYSMKISLHESDNLHDGKPWSVFGYVPQVDQIIEVSSMQNANPLNKNRFSIQERTYEDLIHNSTIGVARTMSVNEIKAKYSDLSGLLMGLRKDIDRYLYVVQRDNKGQPLWIVALAIIKDFEPRCRYFGKDDCEELILIKANDIYKSWTLN